MAYHVDKINNPSDYPEGDKEKQVTAIMKTLSEIQNWDEDVILIDENLYLLDKKEEFDCYLMMIFKNSDIPFNKEITLIKRFLDITSNEVKEKEVVLVKL